jgi:hypothetical protein
VIDWKVTWEERCRAIRDKIGLDSANKTTTTFIILE